MSNKVCNIMNLFSNFFIFLILKEINDADLMLMVNTLILTLAFFVTFNICVSLF